MLAATGVLTWPAATAPTQAETAAPTPPAAGYLANASGEASSNLASGDSADASGAEQRQCRAGKAAKACRRRELQSGHRRQRRCPWRQRVSTPPMAAWPMPVATAAPIYGCRRQWQSCGPKAAKAFGAGSSNFAGGDSSDAHGGNSEPPMRRPVRRRADASGRRSAMPRPARPPRRLAMEAQSGQRRQRRCPWREQFQYRQWQPGQCRRRRQLEPRQRGQRRCEKCNAGRQPVDGVGGRSNRRARLIR